MTDQETLHVALIGSSGGGTATLGHTEAETLLQTVHHHLTLINARLAQAIYIALDDGKSMDSVNPLLDTARLFTVGKKQQSAAAEDTPAEDTLVQVVSTSSSSTTLQQVNEQAWQLQTQMARDILQGKLHALICISMHVPLFQDVLQAAAQCGLAVTCSGGSSLAHAVAVIPRLQWQGNAGGSVATTTQTRAVSYAYSLARGWHRTHLYRPWRSTTTTTQQAPSWTSVLNATLPAFWAVTLTKLGLHHLQSCLEPWLLPAENEGGDGSVFRQTLAGIWAWASNELEFLHTALDQFVLPTVCALVMALSSARSIVSSEQKTNATTVVMASAVAGLLGCRGSILAGLAAGYLVAQSLERCVLYPCIFANVPATMTTLLAAGGWGSLVGLGTRVAVAPAASILSAGVRYWIRWTVAAAKEEDDSGVVLPWHLINAGVWGCLSCWSSKVGYYHALHLPLILLELEDQQHSSSFLGAVDELTLVLVSAGICAANLLLASTEDRALCRRGLLINLGAGDFVEVCYPYMQQSQIINVAGYVASGFSCAVLVGYSHSGDDGENPPPGSLAYLPWPVTLALAGKDWYAMLLASFVAFGIPFLATLGTRLVASSSSSKTKET